MFRKIFIALVLGSFSICQAYSQESIFVAPNGLDKNNGTISAPMKTLSAAVRFARGKGIKTIYMRGGEYYDVSVTFFKKDSGLKILNYNDEKPLLFGGVVLGDGKKEGDFITWHLPGTVNREWDFRMIMVNGEIAKRARFPAKGGFLPLNQWKVKALPSSEGSWERKPTDKDLSILEYNSRDFKSVNIKNADVSIFHYWDESYLGIKSLDTSNNILKFTHNSAKPIGSFVGRNEIAGKYVIWNTKEGLSSPGQWYLDRENEKLVYWPKKGEDISNVKVFVPKHRFVFIFNSEGVENIQLKGLTISGATNKLQNEYFAAKSIDAAILGTKAKNIFLKDISIEKTGGSGIKLNGNQITFENISVNNVGGGGVYCAGENNKIINSKIRDVGLIFKGAVGISFGGKNNAITNCFIENTPYSGIAGVGDDSEIKSCVILNSMLVLSDGAGIYNGGRKNVRVVDNIISFNTNNKRGIYFDEKSIDCVASNNLVFNAIAPLHCHLAKNITFVNNLFLNSKFNQKISTQRSESLSVVDNVIIGPSAEVSNDNKFARFSNNQLLKGVSVSSLSYLSLSTILSKWENREQGINEQVINNVRNVFNGKFNVVK